MLLERLLYNTYVKRLLFVIPAALLMFAAPSFSSEPNKKQEVLDLVSALSQSAQDGDWNTYCENLSLYSQYHLKLHLGDSRTSCSKSLFENKQLSKMVQYQSKQISVQDVSFPRPGVAVVSVSFGSGPIDFVALQEEGEWKADLHPPQDAPQYKEIQKSTRGHSDYKDFVVPPNSSKQKNYAPKTGCLPSFLVEPIREEISVELNDQITSPIVAKLRV